MKKQLVSFILAGFLLLTFSVFGQNNDYPTKKVNGIEYYIYTVQESEGLLAIGRKFEISADEISKANPYIKNGLKVGEQILVPVTKSRLKQNKIAKSNVVKQKFIQHKVEKKQTLFAISHKYNVSQEDIKKYNPQIVSGLREGIILEIPIAVKENSQKITNEPVIRESKPVPAKSQTENKNFKLYKVQPEETLFSISKRNNVEIADIIKLNPSSATKLVVGTELKIPTNTGVSKLKEPKKDTIKVDSKSASDQFKSSEKSNISKKDDSKVIRIAFLLPFMLDQPKNDPKLERFINFYAGALLAIQQAKEKGVSFEIYTYDTENSEDKLTEVLTNPELKKVDLLIGPALTDQVPLVSNFAKEFKINTLIPFTAKVSDIETNPYLFQFNPGSDTELKYLFELLSGKYKNMHIIFAGIQGISPLDEGRISSEALQKMLTKKRRTFSKMDFANSDNVDFASILKKKDKNLIIFNTDKYSNVSPYISSLLSNSKNFDITLFEQYSWKNQSEKMPKCIYISPFNSNYDQLLMDEFDAQFNQYYGKDATDDSPRFDVLGYDLTNYFITFIHRYGSKFGSKLSTTNLMTGIQSQPLFERNSTNSGFINQHVYLGEDDAQ